MRSCLKSYRLIYLSLLVLLLPAELPGRETNLTPVLPQTQRNEGILSRLMENKFPVGVKYYGKIDAEVIRELKETNVNVVFCNPTPQGRQLLRQNNIAFFLNVSVFHAPDEVAKDKTLLATDEKASAEPLDTWQKIVCPTHKEFRTTKIKQIIEEVKKLSPDGVSLDFIRFPVYWEMVKPEQTLLQIAAAHTQGIEFLDDGQGFLQLGGRDRLAERLADLFQNVDRG